MNFRTVLILLFLVASLLCEAPRAEFSDCKTGIPDDKNYTQLAAYYIENCAGSGSKAEVMKLFVERIGARRGEQRVEAVVDALEAMSMLVEQLQTSAGGVDATAAAEFRRALDCDVAQLTGQTTSEELCPAVTDGDSALSKQKWAPARRAGAVFQSSFVDPMLSTADRCAAASVNASSLCQGIFEQRFLPILELHSLMSSQVVPASNSEPAKQVAQHYAVSHERWKNYLSDTGFQYTWELTMNKAVHGGFQEIARSRDAPTSRLIAFHPTVGIFYSSDVADGNDTDLIGIFKLIGFKRWSYDSQNYKPKNVWGLSLVSTFADIPQINDTGLGLLLEYNQISAGYSKHGGAGVFMISIDLASVLSNRPDSLPEWLDLLGE